MIIHPLIQQGMKKYIVLGTQSVKIGPFLVMLSPKTIPLPIGIDRVCDFLTLNTIMRHLRVLLHDQTPSRSIRHEKKHRIRYTECQNRTIFSDFRASNLKITLYNLSRLSLLTSIRYEILESLKMVRFWRSGYLIPCIFSCLIDLEGVWSCRSTRNVS